MILRLFLDKHSVQTESIVVRNEKHVILWRMNIFFAWFCNSVFFVGLGLGRAKQEKEIIFLPIRLKLTKKHDDKITSEWILYTSMYC